MLTCVSSFNPEKLVNSREISSETIPQSTQNGSSSLNMKLKEIISQTLTQPQDVLYKNKKPQIAIIYNENNVEENNSSQINPNLKHIQQSFHSLKQKAENSSSTETMLTIVQLWVADFVMKGVAKTAHSGVPFFLGNSSVSLPILGPVTESIKCGTNTFDIGISLLAFIYQNKILKEAEQELFRLKSMSYTLTPDQLRRLEQLEKIIKYEKSLLNSQECEQHIRLIRNAFSYFTFVFSWLETTHLLTSLTAGSEALIGGFNAALYGIYFYRAHKNLQAHRQWSKDFKAWIKDKTSFVDLESHSDCHTDPSIQASAQHIIEKRAERNAKPLSKIQLLKDKIAQKEISTEHIQARVKDIKHSGLQRFVEFLGLEEKKPEMCLEKFQKALEEKLGKVSLDSTIVGSLHTAYLKLKELNASKPLSPEKQIEIEKNREGISQLLDRCCEEWMKAQDEDTLLATYVDYQSVLDPTIKNSLIDMVRKKHQIEKNFLKVKRVNFGVRFSVGTIICGVALTLAIIGLVATPVGAAALILTALTIGSIAVSFTLLGRGYYCAYRKKPGLTAATLKGAYFRLYAYYALAQIDSAEESIEQALKSTWQKKRNQLATVIDRLPLIHRLFSRKEKKSEAIPTLSTTIETDFQESLSKFKHWKAKAVALENELEKLTWKDFAKQANLQVALKSAKPSATSQDFDTLEALNDALNHVNFDLMSSDTKELLEMQLGIDVKFLQKEIEKDPLLVKKLLLNFFNLDDVAFVKFIGEQRFIEPKKRDNTSRS
jgi:hypothetical protein